MPGAPCLASSAPLTGESELKKLVLGVHCTVSALSGEQRELPGEERAICQAAWARTPACSWSLVSVDSSRGLVSGHRHGEH